VKDRRGFTILEVAVALAILAGVLLVLATTTARFIHTVTIDRVRIQANAAADAHIARIRLWPTYDSLSVEFSGTDNNYPYAGWTRQTTVTHVGGAGQPHDYTRITVAVTAPALDSTVRRTITIAADR
jgi:prepilin-type N-terminal cleavage/methylation domain-containing protein